MRSATVRCCGKRWELELGWRSRNILIAIPFFITGFVLNTFITAHAWWDSGHEAVIATTNLIFLIACVLSLIEIHWEPLALWYVAVFVAEIGALAASVIFLILTFEDLKNHSHSARSASHDMISDQPVDNSNSSITTNNLDELQEKAQRNWVRWEKCISLIFLSWCLLLNSAGSRLIKIQEVTNTNNCEETYDLQDLNTEQKA